MADLSQDTDAQLQQDQESSRPTNAESIQHLAYQGAAAAAAAEKSLAVECRQIEDAILLKQRLARYAAELAHSDPITSATLAFVLRCGQPYFVDARSFSEARGEPNKCTKNAAIEALNCPERTYVEGYIMVRDLTVHHAWTASPDGRLHEQTLPEQYRPIAYYGVPFTGDYVRHSILANERYAMLSAKSRETLPDLLGGTATDWYRHDDPEKLSTDTAHMRAAVQRHFCSLEARASARSRMPS